MAYKCTKDYRCHNGFRHYDKTQMRGFILLGHKINMGVWQNYLYGWGKNDLVEHYSINNGHFKVHSRLLLRGKSGDAS